MTKKSLGFFEAQLRLGQLAYAFIEKLKHIGPRPSFPCEVAILCFARQPDGELAIGVSSTVDPELMQAVMREVLKRTAVEGEPAQ